VDGLFVEYGSWDFMRMIVFFVLLRAHWKGDVRWGVWGSVWVVESLVFVCFSLAYGYWYGLVSAARPNKVL
jgi:hypothetical protein